MRLRRLDLTRYGHFTDSSFELPAKESDFHLIFGPNEAGKSTALAAIEDLLFGIPIHSPYNFLHNYSDMRIGAVLENGSSPLEMLRRKGNKDTLLGPDGSPISGGEGTLRPYLAGADRSFFERMFSLDHVRLQTGGREILAARDDVGQMLFSAGAGILGLRERLGELYAEADELWSVRRANHRKFYIADDKLKEAQRVLREQTFTASRWRELRQTYEQAKEAYTEVDRTTRRTLAELNSLSRIRRVFRDVRRKQELDRKLEELEDVITLPDDAATVMAQAEHKDTETATRIATIQDQLKRTEESLEGLMFDKTLLQRAEDVRQLHERRIEIRSEKADLPKREAELNAAEEELHANASELGWTEPASAALIERLPPRTKIGVVRSLLNQRGELESDVTSGTRVLQESQETYDELKKHLDETGDLADVSRLAIVTRTVREQGDLTGRIRTADKDLKDAQGLVTRRLVALNPGVFDEEALTNMTVPARAQVQEYREREQDWKRRLRETQQQALSVQQELSLAVAAFERTLRDEQVVTAEDLSNARSRRNELWNLVKLKHVQGDQIAEEQGSVLDEDLQDLPGAFEPAMAKTDELADQRFDHAEAASRIAEIKRKIGEQGTLLEHVRKNETTLAEEEERFKAEWSSMWDSVPFDPLAAEAMLDWLAASGEVLAAIQERQEAESAMDLLRSEEREARERLLRELAALGIDVSALENDGLNLIIERATEEHRLREAKADKKTHLEQDVEKATKDVVRRKHDLRQAKGALDQWWKAWTGALGELGLADITPSEAVGAQIDVIEQMREIAGRIRSLRYDRVNKIHRDVTDFEQVVAELVKDIAESLVDRPAEDAVLELERRLAEAERIREFREKKNEEIKDLVKQLTKLKDQRREFTASIFHMKQAAGVETNEALSQAIERSDQRRSLEHEQQQIIDKLQQEGDGMSLDALVEDCDGVVIDDATARESSVRADLEDLQKQQTNVTEARAQARDAFQAVGGDDAAARAAASKQEAFAEFQAVAERYVRVKTSAVLLHWAIDRYRREKQTPLLTRAGELLKIMTGGSFSSLQVAFDDQDTARLMGVRSDGTVVPVSGMSTGTADQLYLALRIASIEDYLERADALPFVADDLFINFDDERATAGFVLLEELSQKTQVLFFTHHHHLVDIAQRTLGASVDLVTLTDHEATAA